MILPHGGSLVEAGLSLEEEQAYRERLPEMKQLVLDPVELSDLELIANGAFSPLTGFMTKDDYRGVVEEMRLVNGLVWSLPITLSIPTAEENDYQPGMEVALLSGNGEFQGVLKVAEVYHRNQTQEALAVYGTDDRKHPGVAYLFSKSETLIGGSIRAVQNKISRDFSTFRFTPRELRQEFTNKGWQTVVAFQTRNPIHRAHEYLQKIALELVDGLLIHPLVGFTKPGDIPAEVRMACYEAIINEYYPRERVLLSVFPAAMRYAGPREAVFHALVRKNYGCTHFIVGRDHAGVGNYYGSYDAQQIFDQFSKREIGIEILKFENTFYCKKCTNLASVKTCPHPQTEQVFLSGTKVRELLQEGRELPLEFSRPEVAKILRQYYREIM